MIDDQIGQLEREISNNKPRVEFGAALERLKLNKDFKEVVLKGYFEKEAIRLVHLKAEAAMQTPDRQADIVRQIDAIGQLVSFLNTALQLSEMARKQIESAEGERTLLLEEQADGGND